MTRIDDEHEVSSLRLAVGPALMCVALFVFAARLYYLQVASAQEMREKAISNRTIEVETPAPRGSIWDAKGRLVAGVDPKLVVMATPRKLEDRPEAVARAAGILGMEADELQKKLNGERRRDFPVAIAMGISLEQAAQFTGEQFGLLSGFQVESQPLRVMTRPEGLAHVLGWVHRPTEKVMERLKAEVPEISEPQFAGRAGIEAAHDIDLLGHPGLIKLAVDKDVRPIKRVQETPPVPGRGLVLGLNQEFQSYAEGVLRSAGKGIGAFAAIDPRTGVVLALVASPSYDLKLFEGGISQQNYSRLLKDPGRPMVQRAIAGAWSPGSTFKVVTAVAARQAGQFDPDRNIYCRGGLTVGGTLKKCLNHPSGMSLNFESAMAYSCNTYFMTLAREIGPEAMRKTSLALGFGKPLGLDVLGEGKGLVKTAEWMAENKETWQVGNTVHFGIGQDAVTTTPLQMANAAALAANGGFAFRPHVVQSIVEPAPNRKVVQVEPELALDLRDLGSFWDLQRSAMRAVTRYGTARSVASPIEGGWAGKTGSTQDARQAQPHAWFIGYAPAENPEIAFALILEGAGHGGAVATPVASQLVRRWFEFQSMPDSAEANSLARFLDSSAGSGSLALR